MSDRLLKEPDVINLMMKWYGNGASTPAIIRAIKEIPSHQGKWEKLVDENNPYRIRCSICMHSLLTREVFPYCPYCGARMKGVEDD